MEQEQNGPVLSPSGNVIELRKVFKSFGTNTVLRGVDLDVKPGENVVVL
jgi:ABC-type transporter Mla maintaining outer membrane lipid asymmetry ATPase subunit MlaF